jgi:hypothetical protein
METSHRAVKEKADDASHVEDKYEVSDPDRPLTPAEEGDDGKVTLKMKLAVLSLILMYEAYLFTLIMSVSQIFQAISHSVSTDLYCRPAAVLTYIDAELGPDTRYPWIAITQVLIYHRVTSQLTWELDGTLERPSSSV